MRTIKVMVNVRTEQEIIDTLIDAYGMDGVVKAFISDNILYMRVEE